MAFKNTDIKPFEQKVWLSSPTMHGEELAYMKEVYEANFYRRNCKPSQRNGRFKKNLRNDYTIFR